MFFLVLEFELRTSHLLGRCSTTWASPPALLVLFIFEIGACIYTHAGLDHPPPICAPNVDGRCTPLCPATDWDGVSWTFCFGKSWNMILLISTSPVTRITDVSQYVQARWAFYLFPAHFLGKRRTVMLGCGGIPLHNAQNGTDEINRD
jgi:hypothetical protein